jgi:mxaJ protein
MTRTMLVLIVAIAGASACTVRPSHAGVEPLRVCADPNNLPFTNSREEGFENRIARLLARDLGTRVEYVWWAQRRGFLRNTLNAGTCDVVMGLPTRMEMALTTRPYYRSTYVFVSRRDRHLRIHSFDDRRLKRLRIGVPQVGDDGASAPPAHALARRGLVRNLVQYSVFGDYARESPPSELIAAVARGEVDVAAAWGPLAGFFAARQPNALELTPIEPDKDTPFLPVAFDMSMGVRRKDAARKTMLDAFLERRRGDIDAILAAFHVPRVDTPAERGSSTSQRAEDVF